MERPFSKTMLKSIESQIEHCHQNSGILDVYKASERVRRENLSDNIALEDIMEHFVDNVGTRCKLEFLAESADEIAKSEFRATPLVRLPLINGDVP